MGTPAVRRFTLEDYWAVEMSSPVRFEFLHGTIYAMAGGSARHDEVASNVHLALGVAFDGSACHPLGADQRIGVSDDAYTYADVSLFRARLQIADGNPPDTATNPSVLVEVLSDPTREYDTTEKLAMYRALPSVREVLLIEPVRVHVAQWIREGDGWRERVHAHPDGSLEVLGRRIELRQVYARRLT